MVDKKQADCQHVVLIHPFRSELLRLLLEGCECFMQRRSSRPGEAAAAVYKLWLLPGLSSELGAGGHLRVDRHETR